MMLRPPLQYQSLKVVLLHMDANSRLQISLQMPSIRNFERMIPLKMSRFKMEEFGTKINDTCVILPGDVAFNEKFELRFDSEFDERFFTNYLRAYEKALEKLTELKSKGLTVKGYLRTLEPLSNMHDGEEHRIRDALKYPSQYLRARIADNKLWLLPYDCRKNNTKPPFTCYIQLTIRKWCGISKTWSEKIRRFEYNRKLFEAVKHLNSFLFGNRTMPIHVGSFVFCFAGGIFRLPPNFRLQANDVHVTRLSVVNEKLPLLVENSETLDSLYMYYSLTPNDFQSQIVRNAKRLVLVEVSKNVMQELFPTIRDLPHRDLSIMPRRSFLPEDYFQIIEAWLSGNRSIGASCWIRISTDEMASEILKLVRTRNEGTNETNRGVTIPRNDSSKVEVFYVPFEGPINNYHFSRGNQTMKIRIVEV